MDINITKLSDKEIADICIKYNIIQSNELRNHTRNQVIEEINKWVQYKNKLINSADIHHPILV